MIQFYVLCLPAGVILNATDNSLKPTLNPLNIGCGQISQYYKPYLPISGKVSRCEDLLKE